MTGDFTIDGLPSTELPAGAGNAAESAVEVSEVERLVVASYPDDRTFLDRLLKLRQQWVVANKQNRFDEGIKAVLTKVYPDKAHFIYELLQNAQDARATWVRFDLQPDRLVVTHNGEKLFDRRDVIGITSIGGSIKEDDVNQIGKFGIGFKAVFAYTASPRVFSKDYQFEIRDLVCPYPLEVRHTGWNELETRFEFPFNHAKKSAGQAFDETANGLRSLPDNVLLFLNHIDTIEWGIGSEGTKGMSRLVYDDKHVEIERSSPWGDARTNSHWLRFRPDKPAKISVTIDDEPKDVIADVAIAFALVLQL